jgi:glucan biosynthesis protein
VRRRVRPTFRRPDLFLRRVDVAALRGLAAALVAFSFSATCAAFSFDDVALRAKQLAAASYKKPDVNLP